MGAVFIALGLFLGYLEWKGPTAIENAGSLLKTELWGSNNPFYRWLGALVIVWAIGLIPDMRGISTAMLVLILLSMALSHASAVEKISKAL